MNFFKKEDPKEQLKKNDRELRKTNRELGADRRDLERKEKELELEIKKAAKAGQKDVCTVLAKQLVQLRKQKTKNLGMSAKISAVGAQGKTMKSMNVMANAVGTTTQTMKAMEKQMPLDKFAADLREFTQQQDKMDMRSELMEETLDSMLDADSDAENEVINQVLDEIGIEMNAKVAKAPAIPGHSFAHSSKEDDLDKILASLAK